MSEWKSLGEVCDFSKDKVAISVLDLGNYISTENLLPNKGGVTEAASLPKIVTTTSFNVGDILISNIRPYFKKIWRAKFSGGCSNDVLVIRAKKNVEPRFLYYVLSEDKFFDLVTATAKGTKMPRGDKQVIMNYPVPDFPLETQKKIAAVLSALDDKIELNNAINKNLEEQAQTIYKNMFVDNFNPAWKSGTLSDIVDVRDGTHDSPKKVDDKFFLITSKHLLPFGVEISSANTISEKDFNKINERSAVNKHDILLSMIGTVGIISFVIESDINFAIKNVGLIKTSEKPQYKYYLLSYLKSNFMRQYIERVLAGTTQKYISLAELRKIPVNFSDSQTLNEYNVRVEPIFLKIAANIQENQKLGEIRDLLLPRLMSGEIDVSAVEI